MPLVQSVVQVWRTCDLVLLREFYGPSGSLVAGAAATPPLRGLLLLRLHGLRLVRLLGLRLLLRLLRCGCSDASFRSSLSLCV